MNLRVCLSEVDSGVLKQLTNKEAGALRYTLEASMDVYVKAAKWEDLSSVLVSIGSSPRSYGLAVGYRVLWGINQPAGGEVGVASHTH